MAYKGLLDTLALSLSSRINRLSSCQFTDEVLGSCQFTDEEAEHQRSYCPRPHSKRGTWDLISPNLPISSLKPFHSVSVGTLCMHHVLMRLERLKPLGGIVTPFGFVNTKSWVLIPHGMPDIDLEPFFILLFLSPFILVAKSISFYFLNGFGNCILLTVTTVPS